MSVSSIQSNIEKTLENIFSMTKKILIRNTILLISFVILFVLFPSIYYLYTFKLFNIVHDYPILSIFLTLLTFFSCLVIILLKFEKSVDINILYKILYNLMYVGAIFLLFSLLFHVSKFFVYSSNSTSIYLSFILLTLFLSLRNSFERESFDDDILDMKDDLFVIIKNVLFLIPCYIVDFLEWVQKNVSGIPKPSYILSVCIVLVIVLFILIPMLNSFIKSTSGLTFVQKSKTLEKPVLFMTQKQLKDKLIDSKPFLRRNLLRKNNDFKRYLEKDSGSISDLNKVKNIEGFDKTIHLLDRRIIYDDEINSLSTTEKTLLEEEMKKNKLTLDDFKSFETLKKYILSLRQEDKYYELLYKIGEYNKMKNDFIYQEASSLVNLINRTNHIQDYNYHYGISFWVYFDPQIQTIKTRKDKRGFIMTYSNSPKIFYDYDTKELKISIDYCENQNNRCSENIIYKTKEILYQRWNHFVVNYNYGTLDCFINNNLAMTKSRVAPYIEDAFLQFGSENEPLYNCGICNIKYFEVPLNLPSIGEIYKTKQIPCDS
jgi:hypothetical protein